MRYPQPDVWIEVDFDERFFPEYVWNGLFVAARALRHVVQSELERVRITGHAVNLDGDPTKVARIAVTLHVTGESQTRVFEFAPGGRWRVRPAGVAEDAPFLQFMPNAGHDYERDILRRTELQVGLLQQEVQAWLHGLQSARP